MRRGLLVVLLLAVFAQPAAADWTYASSDHFEVYTTGGGRRAREALAYFERVHAFFSDFLGISPRTPAPTRLIIFSNAREFRPYRISEAAIAYYRSGADRDSIVMQSFDAEAYPIVVHEYAHLIARHSGAPYPLWLNEGLAEFFSTLSSYGGQMSIGRVPQGRLRYLASGVRLLDLERLFAVDHESPEYRTESHAGVFYSQSWALTHMLFTGDDYRQGWAAFLRQMGSGRPAADVLQEVYGKSLADVFGDLQSYIRGGRYIFLSVDYRSPSDDARYPEREVDAFEAGLVTANLLAGGRGGEEQARAAFDALAAERPDDLALLESRAYFELQSGARDRALPLLARAVELGSRSARLYRDYAMLAGADAERRESLLKQAVALDPDHVDTRLAYASALLQRRQGAEAVAVLQPIANVSADQAFMFFQLAANAHLQLNQIEEGRNAAGRAAAHARTPAEQEYAARLLASIDEFLARRAAAGSGAPAGGNAAPPPPAAAASAADPDLTSMDGKPLTEARGRLRNIVCGGRYPVAEIVTGTGTTLRLQIDMPDYIHVRGSGSVTVDLNCGAQDTPVRVGFFRPDGLGESLNGSLRLLDYRPPADGN